MRRSLATAVSAIWGIALGGTFGCLLPSLSGEWRFRHLLPAWWIAQAAGGVLIALGLWPIIASFAAFIASGGTPVPVAAPPRLVVSGCYRYVRNPIYVGFLVVLLGEVLLFGSLRLLGYTAVAFCIGAAAVRFYEEPHLARTFGAEYQAYCRSVRAFIPRLHPWDPQEPSRH